MSVPNFFHSYAKNFFELCREWSLVCPACGKHTVQVRPRDSEGGTRYLFNCYNIMCPELPELNVKDRDFGIRMWRTAQKGTKL